MNALFMSFPFLSSSLCVFFFSFPHLFLPKNTTSCRDFWPISGVIAPGLFFVHLRADGYLQEQDVVCRLAGLRGK